MTIDSLPAKPQLSMTSKRSLTRPAAVLNAAAQNLGMLIAGRIMLGIGIGAANQSVPLYLSEVCCACLLPHDGMLAQLKQRSLASAAVHARAQGQQAFHRFSTTPCHCYFSTAYSDGTQQV